MKNWVENKYQELHQKMIRGGRTNLSEWFERMAAEFYEERAVDEIVYADSIKERLYNDLTK